MRRGRSATETEENKVTEKVGLISTHSCACCNELVEATQKATGLWPWKSFSETNFRSLRFGGPIKSSRSPRRQPSDQNLSLCPLMPPLSQNVLHGPKAQDCERDCVSRGIPTLHRCGSTGIPRWHWAHRGTAEDYNNRKRWDFLKQTVLKPASEVSQTQYQNIW